MFPLCYFNHKTNKGKPLMLWTPPRTGSEHEDEKLAEILDFMFGGEPIEPAEARLVLKKYCEHTIETEAANRGIQLIECRATIDQIYHILKAQGWLTAEKVQDGLHKVLAVYHYQLVNPYNSQPHEDRYYLMWMPPEPSQPEDLEKLSDIVTLASGELVAPSEAHAFLATINKAILREEEPNGIQCIDCHAEISHVYHALLGAGYLNPDKIEAGLRLVLGVHQASAVISTANANSRI